MPTTFTTTLHVDTADKRITRDTLSTLVTGQISPPYGEPVDGWVTLSDAWVDPISSTLMLAPMRMLPAWHTTTSGIYTRLGKASFTLSEAAKWNDVQNKLAGDTWIAGESLSANTSGITTGTYAKNRGWMVSFFGFNALDDDQFIQLECGWNSTVSGASGVSLRFYSSSNVEVWKDGVQVGSGSVSGGRASQQNADRATVVLLVPMNKRQLLITSNQGDGFVHTFEDIDEDDANPTIVGATNFWFRLPEGGTAQLQLAPLQFPTSGYALGLKSVFRDAPGSGETASHELFRYLPYYGTQGVSSSLVEVGLPGTAFTPDGVKTEAQVKVAFTGDGISTAFVAGARSWFDRLTDDVAGTEADITDYVKDLSIEFGTHASTAGATFTILQYEDAETNLSLVGLKDMAERPWEVRVTESVGPTTFKLWAGSNDLPLFRLSTNHEVEPLSFSAGTIWKRLQEYRFVDSLPLDGYTLKQAFETIIAYAGLETAQYSVSASTLPMAMGGSCSIGEFGYQIEEGDTAADWIDRLHEDLCATWRVGFELQASGKPKLVIESPADMEATSCATIYTKRQDSIDNAADPDIHLAYSWEEYRVKPEANEIIVTGFDPARRRPIQFRHRVASSQDPTLSPALRPDNWLGGQILYGLADPSITSVDIGTQATEQLRDRLTHARVIATARGPMWADSTGLPIIHGRLITCRGFDWRVMSSRATYEQDCFGRPVCEYMLERTAEDYPAGGRLVGIKGSARQIAEFVRAGVNLWPVRTKRRGSDRLRGAPVEIFDI